jgi:hypothetical protein
MAGGGASVRRFLDRLVAVATTLAVFSIALAGSDGIKW